MSARTPQRSFAHYLHMAFGNWRDYLHGREEVSLKKYLYVFRPPFGGLRALPFDRLRP